MALAAATSFSKVISGSGFPLSSSSSEIKGKITSVSVCVLLCWRCFWKQSLTVVCVCSVSQIGSFRLLDRPHVASTTLSQRRSFVKPVNAEPKRNVSIVPLAATVVAPGEWNN